MNGSLTVIPIKVAAAFKGAGGGARGTTKY